MKARDVIPGWPRGRTTETYSGQEFKPGWTWYPNDEWLRDHEADVEYHRQQQKMLWDFIERRSNVVR